MTATFFLLTAMAMAAGPFEGVWTDTTKAGLWNFKEKPTWIEGYLTSSSYFENMYIKKTSDTTGEGTVTRTISLTGARTIFTIKLTLLDPAI